MFLRTLHVLVLLAVSTMPAVALADDSGWVYAPHDNSPGNVPIEDQQQINGLLDQFNNQQQQPPQNDGGMQYQPVDPTVQYQPDTQHQPEVYDGSINPHIEPVAPTPAPSLPPMCNGCAW